MRHFSKLLASAFVAGLLLTACQTDPEDKGFSISENEIIAGAEGLSADVKITSDGGWIATTNVPWVAVSPVNGRGPVECKIIVDTTSVDVLRKGTVRFESVEDGTSLSLDVEQYGYKKFILVSESEVSVPEYAETNKRMFDVEITANVKFTINTTDGGGWVSHDGFNLELDKGLRPRKTKVRFRYMNNTRPMDRESTITFTPANYLDQLDESETITVIQKKAPPIEDNRQGDSMAVIAIARAVKFNMGANEGKSMDKWDFVKLWDFDDEGYTPELKGRLRYVSFFSITTWLNVNDFAKSDELPYELGYLKTVEELVLYANANSLLVSLSSGEIGKLTNLKRLTLYSLGLNRLEEEGETNFANLSKLEYLDLSGNNFNGIPAVLTPENFPNLKHLDLGLNKRFTIVDLSTTPRLQNTWGGLYGTEDGDGEGVFPARLLEWENLEYLSLGNNYIHGTLPDMAGYVKYEATDEYITARGDSITYAVGLPRVWPKMKTLRMNLNYLKGDIPDWLLYHPNLDLWDPFTLVFNQNASNLIDAEGNLSGFDNVPENDNYYYQAYPKLDPAHE